MEKLGQRKKGTAFDLYRGAKAGGKKEDLLRYWDYGTQKDPVSQEEIDILENEWLKPQREKRGEGHSYKGGPLELRREKGPDVMEMLKSNPDLYNEYLRYNSFFKNVKVDGETPTMEDWNLERESGYPFTKNVEGLIPKSKDDNAFDSMVKAATKNEYKMGE